MTDNPKNNGLHNKGLNKAKGRKQDEFYTQLSDIEEELKHYKSYFKDKVVYCNCDDPRASNFPRYFVLNFEQLGLKKLIATCYINQDTNLFSDRKRNPEKAIYLEYEGGNKAPNANEIKELKGDGDFRSKECIEFLKQSDIVVTNPPFSLFREYVDQLIEYDKKFLIIGCIPSIACKNIFRYFKEGKLRLGYKGTMNFKCPEHYETSWEDEDGQIWKRVGSICWFTNLNIKKRREDLILYKNYSPEKYPKYDNYDAINISKVADIPMDYKGAMGVPVTFLDKYNPAQFEIVRFRKGDDNKDLSINGKCPYARIIIKKHKD